jgi:hypothetical protein
MKILHASKSLFDFHTGAFGATASVNPPLPFSAFRRGSDSPSTIWHHSNIKEKVS